MIQNYLKLKNGRSIEHKTLFGKNIDSYESVDKNKKKIQFNLDKYNNSVFKTFEGKNTAP